MSHRTPDRGKLDLDTLKAMIGHEEIETVITAFPDMYGNVLSLHYSIWETSVCA